MAFRNLSTSSIFTGTKSSKLWDQTTFPGIFESIGTITTISSTTVTNIIFNNIPQNYSHLQIRGIAKRSGSGVTSLGVRLNSASSNYNWHTLRGTGSTVTSEAATYFSEIALREQYIGNVTSGSDLFSAFVIDVLDYSNENKNTTIRSLGGYNNNLITGTIGLSSGVWLSTNPITSIMLMSDFTYRSSFSLYGIRGA